jgi:HlyD family secretion protein
LGAVLPSVFSPDRRTEADPAADHYLTSPVEGIVLPKIVTATGALNASIVVEVGSQLSGLITTMVVDFNDDVKKGQVLAQLDQSTFNEQVASAKANLDGARADARTTEARLARAMIDVQQTRMQRAVLSARTDIARVGMELATRESKRKASLLDKGAAPAIEVLDSLSRKEAAVATLREAEANLEINDGAVEAVLADVTRIKAEIDSAAATIRRLDAQLASAKVELDRTLIRAPIDGVIVGRNVTQGQTLASSLESKTLFNIAGDLRRMEIYARVDESDISKIALGQHATFTVDSFPGREFKAKVTQIRKAPQVLQNVVTYTVVLGVANDDYTLFPGMTVVSRIVTEAPPSSLSVPMAALGYKPSFERLGAAVAPTQTGPVVWALRQGALAPVQIVTGEDDGERIAVKSDALRLGDLVVIGEKSFIHAARASSTNGVR